MEHLGHDEFLEEYRRVLEVIDGTINPKLKKVLQEAERRMSIGGSDFKKQRKMKPGQLNKDLTKQQTVNKWLNK